MKTRIPLLVLCLVVGAVAFTGCSSGGGGKLFGFIPSMYEGSSGLPVAQFLLQEQTKRLQLQQMAEERIRQEQQREEMLRQMRQINDNLERMRR